MLSQISFDSITFDLVTDSYLYWIRIRIRIRFRAASLSRKIILDILDIRFSCSFFGVDKAWIRKQICAKQPNLDTNIFALIYFLYPNQILGLLNIEKYQFMGSNNIKINKFLKDTRSGCEHWPRNRVWYWCILIKTLHLLNNNRIIRL